MPETSPDTKGVRKLVEAIEAYTPLETSSLPNLSSSGAAPDVESRHTAADVRLLGEIIDAAPSLPAERREAVVALLTGLMADHRRLDDYSGYLDSMLKGTALERSEPLEAPAVDERDERIAREGFAWLPDEDLAGLAVSPRGLKELYVLLEEPETECGAWLNDALMAAHGEDPKVLESENRTRERIARLMAGDESTD